MRRRSSRDAASTHVLEAVTVASIMLGAASFALTFEMRPPGDDVQRSVLQQKADDILATLAETPVVGNSYGDTMLEVLLQECLQEDCAPLRAKIEKLLPVGARYAVYLSTPEGLHPIVDERAPAGAAVTARRSVEPAWSHTFLAPAQNVFDPAQDPLVTYNLPVWSGSPVEQGGSPLRILVSGNRTADNASYTLKGSATTRAVSAGEGPTPSAISAYFHTGNGTPLASYDARPITLNATFFPTGAPVPLRVRLNESAGGAIPAGTLLSVDLPRGWNASASSALNAGNWTILSNATDRNGSTQSVILAQLSRAVSSGVVDLAFNATYHGDVTDHSTLVARLSGGAHARAEILVRADRHAVAPPLAIPTIVASVPRPLGTNATTTWTLAAFSTEPIRVTKVEIAEENAKAIFANVATLSGPGAWSATGSSLVWTGNVTLTAASPLNLTFRVTSTPSETPSLERAPFVPSLAAGTLTARAIRETAPGFHLGVHLPKNANYAGYDTATGPALRGNHTATSASIYRTTPLPGDVNYSVGPVAALKDSAFGSTVTSARRAVAPGETVLLSIDVQSILYQLGTLGLTPSVDLAVYPPWADAKAPVLTKEVYNGTLAKGNGTFLALIDTNGDLVPDPTSVGRHNETVAVARTWLYGPYVTEVRVSWIEQIAGLVGGVPATETMLRTAYVYDYFVVKPPGSALPPSAVYDAHLVVWLEDWR